MNYETYMVGGLPNLGSGFDILKVFKVFSIIQGVSIIVEPFVIQMKPSIFDNFFYLKVRTIHKIVEYLSHIFLTSQKRFT